MRLALLAVAALGVFRLNAHADTMYNYVGQDFRYVDGSYTTMDKVTGSFTVAKPIAADYSGMVDVLSYTFSDGVQTLTNVNMPRHAFDVTTDATGQIIYYFITANEPTVDPYIWLVKGNDASLGDYGWNWVVSRNGSAATVPVYGEFTEQSIGSPTPPASVTPEPSSFALLGTGLLGVTGAVRRRLA